jgi:hypothetical protein
MITRFDKAIVALIMSIFGLLNVIWEIPIPFTEDQLSTILAVLTPILVYLIPNKKEDA